MASVARKKRHGTGGGIARAERALGVGLSNTLLELQGTREDVEKAATRPHWENGKLQVLVIVDFDWLMSCVDDSLELGLL